VRFLGGSGTTRAYVVHAARCESADDTEAEEVFSPTMLYPMGIDADGPVTAPLQE
jgi:hypothetical protein